MAPVEVDYVPASIVPVKNLRVVNKAMELPLVKVPDWRRDVAEETPGGGGGAPACRCPGDRLPAGALSHPPGGTGAPSQESHSFWS